MEGAKKARDSIVMSQDGTQLIAGRVRAVLSHSAPGCDPALEHEANLAHAEWFAQVPGPMLQIRRACRSLDV